MSGENVSLPVAQALASALAKIEAYVPTEYVDNSEPDLDAEHLNHAEQGIMRVTNLLNAAVDVIQGQQSRLADAENKIGTAALTGGMTDLSSGLNKLDSDLDSVNTKLRFIKNFNNPNEELKLTQYAYCNYVSIGNTSGYGYATIYGMYDNNNGKAISGQMAITSSGEVLKRSYKNGAWTTWKNVDDYDTNLKRMPLDGTVEFNQFTITKNTSGKYVLNFYKNTAKIASIVSA